MTNYKFISNMLIFSVISQLGLSCSPTKFSNNSNSLCDAANSSENCIVSNGVTTVSQEFEVGSGKVDILFVNDNSASMSKIQQELASRFSGFIEKLDLKNIDYNIAITTTDIVSQTAGTLIEMAPGKKYLNRLDSNRVSLFNSAIVRRETAQCESFIKSAYNTYGPIFNTTAYYSNNYDLNCPSNDERGIFSAHDVLSNNINSFIRKDANLNIILISNEDVRSGLYRSSQYANAYLLDNKDKASNFSTMMSANYPDKFWEFNSIITKDNVCALQQQNLFTGSNGQVIKDQFGSYAIAVNSGLEYAALSASASKDIDGNNSPRGQILNICSSDYSVYFSNIAGKISDSARLFNLKCKPTEAPVVSLTDGAVANIPYSWDGGSKIVFKKGSEGLKINISYKCYTGVK